MKITPKKILSALLAAVLLLTILPDTALRAKAAPNAADKKACWISFLDIEETLRDKNAAEFTQKLSSMYDNVAKYGMNTVIVHVRAMGDAMYPSSYYPW